NTPHELFAAIHAPGDPSGSIAHRRRAVPPSPQSYPPAPPETSLRRALLDRRRRPTLVQGHPVPPTAELPVLALLLQAVVDDPRGEDRWLVLADWLEEHDDPRRAELLRLHRRLLATCCEPRRYPERALWQERVVALLTEGVRPCVPQKTLLLGKRKVPM